MAIEEREIKNVVSMEKVRELLDELNPEQRVAAEAIYGPVLVLAGAGSGKTKTLTYRIANMLAQGAKPSEIFVATFTNKAAKEMKERIAKAVGEETVRDLWMGTFHSLCVRILRKHGHLLGYESNFTIMDAGDSLDLIKRIYKMHNVEEGTKPGLAMHYMDNAKNNLFTPDYCMHEEAETASDRMCSLVYRDFQMMAKEMNAMDFGDLIMNVVTLLEEHPDAREYWQNRFKFVLSDEYQDANHAQYHLLRLLAFPHNNIFVVGDPQQSIYKFRGAVVNLILNFESQYFPCTTVRLSTNYRSNHVIVRAGNELMKQNSHIRLELHAHNPEMNVHPILIMKTQNEQTEAAFISYQIQKLVKAGTHSYGDFAILYRTNDQSAPFEQMFMHNMIPYKVVGGTGFFQREEIKDVVAYLKSIVNRKDDGAITRIINKPSRGIGDTTVNHIVEYANNNKVSVARAMKNVDDIPTIKKGPRGRVRDFLGMLDHFDSMNHLDIRRYVHYVLEQSGYMAMWAGKKDKEAEERVDNINEFLRLVERYKEENPDKTLTDFMQEISLLMDFDNNEKDNAVRMMSIHGSKGLEFPVVFGVGMNEGLFPSWRSFNPEDVEEERRLAYVLVTRAENQIILTTTRERTNFKGGKTAQDPSRFLDELPEELIFHSEIKPKS